MVHRLTHDPCVRHVRLHAARHGRVAQWPQWADSQLIDAYRAHGIQAPWSHQVAVAEHAHAGSHVVVATGTASGKSLAFALPSLTALLDGANAPNGRGATALYLAPTKALAHDQWQSLRTLDLPHLRVSPYDGDTPDEERAWIRQHAQYVLTNPDLLHHSLLPGHRSWSSFLRALRYVVVDECHAYRGLFGSHVGNVLRRLQRVAHSYGADPVFILASATVADPGESAARLVGRPVVAVTDDGSPHGATTISLWEPPLTDGIGEGGAPVRRSVLSEAADLLTDLVVAGTRTLVFVRSRRGAEAVASIARERLAQIDSSLPERVAAYRGGYLPEERRQLEHDLRTGQLLGVATTSALELGIDVHGLDVVITAGWPGTRASWWQQMGRAGRAGADSHAVLIARDDPLDTYLVAHPEAILDTPVESTVFDPGNTFVLAPHLLAAAAELPLTPNDFSDDGVFTSTATPVLDELVTTGWLRSRPTGWFFTRHERASDLADLRGIGGAPVRIIEEGTGRVLGSVDAGAANAQVHTGAIYVHQGLTYLIVRFAPDEAVAHARREQVDYSTHARVVSSTELHEVLRHEQWNSVGLSFGAATVTSQVVGYLVRRVPSGEVLGEFPLDLPSQTLNTRAVWFTVPAPLLESAAIGDADIPGAAHAAEHASIGLLPLFAGCDRWDIGGLSTAHHPDTGECTIIVHDGHPGGAGFAERGFDVAEQWLTATRDAITACECEAGCPSCVQSPKCGNGNDPLDKQAAARLLSVVLSQR